MAESRAGRRTFGPVVLAGLVAAGLLAAAAAKPWFEGVRLDLDPGVPAAEVQAESPLVLALALVVLAGWGAVLVTRARARRLIAAVTVLAALGALAGVVAAPFTLPDQIDQRYHPVSPSAWFVVAAIAAVIGLLALLLAWRLAPTWPEMGSRYDAPGGGRAAPDVDTDDPRALWRALDEGQDPTEHPTDRDVP